MLEKYLIQYTKYICSDRPVYYTYVSDVIDLNMRKSTEIVRHHSFQQK